MSQQVFLNYLKCGRVYFLSIKSASFLKKNIGAVKIKMIEMIKMAMLKICIFSP